MANPLILTGPTGSGKSALALALAQRLDAEIISMDSMAVYQHMDIGTAKPTDEDRRAVPHHLVDVRPPSEPASVAWWLDEAKLISTDIEKRGKRVLMVGGTPLYLKSVLFGLADNPPANPEIRARLEAEAERDGSPALHERLTQIDPASGERIHPNDARRIVRALEVWESTGKTMTDWQQQWPDRVGATGTSPDFTIPPGACRWLDWPRDELYRRIDTRVERMLEAGWLDEVRHLLALDPPMSREASMALGYRELADFLRDGGDLDEVTKTIQQRSRNFAKRQLTWFRNLPICEPVSPSEANNLWE